VEHLKEVLTKNGSDIIALKKWGDRPLAFPIKKQKRGIYILVYFSAPTDKYAAIERSFNLSEQLLRHMITKAEHLTVEEMKNADGQLDLTVEANLRAQPPEPAPGAAPAPAPVTTSAAAVPAAV
ncbi:MAG: 30S ribosomal protein S6, partial [Phycisphaerales bacterium]